MNRATLCSVAMVTLFAFISLGVVADPNPSTRFINMWCNNAQFTDDSLFAKALEGFMEDLTNPQKRAAFPMVGGSCQTNFFIQADCGEAFWNQGCADCFSVIRNEINMVCKNNMGVQLVLQDCKLRYETYHFDWIKEVSAPAFCPFGTGLGG